MIIIPKSQKNVPVNNSHLKVVHREGYCKQLQGEANIFQLVCYENENQMNREKVHASIYINLLVNTDMTQHQYGSCIG